VADRSDNVAGEHQPRRTERQPLRFTLRSLLLVTALVALALAVWQAVGPAIGLVLLVVLTAVSLHVLGNAMGTRLREQGTRRSSQESRDDSLPEGALRLPLKSAPLPAYRFAPVTHLSRRTSLGWLPLVATGLAGLVGAIVGGRALQNLDPQSATWSTLALGAVATGALAAMFAYWTTGWLQVVLAAWWQAHRHGRSR
jgi:predicted MFS family arabinose efflux permease